MSAVLSIYLSLSRVPAFSLWIISNPRPYFLGWCSWFSDAPFLSRGTCPSNLLHFRPCLLQSQISGLGHFSLESMRQIAELMTLPWNQGIFAFHKRWDFYIWTLTHRECSHMWTFSSTSRVTKAWFESKMGWEKGCILNIWKKSLTINPSIMQGLGVPTFHAVQTTL